MSLIKVNKMLLIFSRLNHQQQQCSQPPWQKPQYKISCHIAVNNNSKLLNHLLSVSVKPTTADSCWFLAYIPTKWATAEAMTTATTKANANAEKLILDCPFIRKDPLNLLTRSSTSEITPLPHCSSPRSLMAESSHHRGGKRTDEPRPIKISRSQY